MAKPPLLLRGGLTGRVYVVTSYKDLGDGNIEAKTKHDVTDQYLALRADEKKSKPRRACPVCGSQTYEHSKWSDRKQVGCTDCPTDG